MPGCRKAFMARLNARANRASVVGFNFRGELAFAVF